MFSYQDYLQAQQQMLGRSGDLFGSNGPGTISEADWNALPSSDRGMMIDSLQTGQPNHLVTDPTVTQRFQSQTGGNVNGQLYGSYADPTGLNANIPGFFRGDPRADPSRNIFDPQSGQYLIESGNQSPQFLQALRDRTHAANQSDARFAAAGVGSVLGAGLLGNALLAANTGSAVPVAAGSSGGMDLTPMANIPETQLGTLGPDVQWGAAAGAPVTDLSVGAPVTDLSVHAGLGDTASNLFSGGTSGIGSLLGGGNTLQTILRGAGLLTTASGLFGKPGGSTSNTSGGNGASSDKGGSGQGLQGMNVSRGAYTPNPVTAQQLANFRYATPIQRGR